MRAEFHEPDDEEKRTVATAVWDGRTVTVSADAPEVRDTIAHAFRRTPIAVDDPSRRRMGTNGVIVLQPGTLEWFRATAHTRAAEETGLGVRFVPGAIVGGFDPAAGYRPFDEQVERLDERSRQPLSRSQS
jgi:hypothetical protein